MRGQPNHLLSSTLDCHQATFRDLMIKGEFGRCDWLKQSHNLETHTGHIQKARFSTNHSAVFPFVHQTTEFRQTTV